MRKYFALALVFILIWSCDWQPDEIQVDGLTTIEQFHITPGDTVILELSEGGSAFSAISNPDTGVVEILNHLTSDLGNRLLLIGKSEGEVEVSFNYEITLESGETVSAYYHVYLHVTESIPLNVEIGDEFDLDFSLELTSEQLSDLDSVVVTIDNDIAEGEIEIGRVPDVLTRLTVSGERPGFASLVIEGYSVGGGLVFSLFYNVEISIHKTVMAELYTNTGCVNCPEANHYLDNLLTEYEDDFALVRYHVNWTDPFDPMNLYNPVDVEERRAYYNIFAAPGLVLEGTLVTTLDENDWSGRVFNASKSEALIYISTISINESMDSLHLQYDLDTFGEMLSNFTVWSMVMEDSIEYSGSNGENIHMQVMRDMTSSSLSSLNTLTTIEHSLKKPDDYGTAGPMNVLVFIQSESDKVVMQARKQNLY